MRIFNKKTFYFMFFLQSLFVLFFSEFILAQEKHEGSTNDRMILIPAGHFKMGSDKNFFEQPVHTVNIKSFYMDKYEVTNGEYKKCVDAGKCTKPGDLSSKTRSNYYEDLNYTDYPVVYVDWYQAKTFCEWIGKRLPSEDEWEYAARGGLEGKKYPNGNDIDCTQANYGRAMLPEFGDCYNYGNKDNDTHRVGSYPPNGYGLYDMAGNVAEWTNGSFYYYDNSPSSDDDYSKMTRGGAYFNSATKIRVADRAGMNASIKTQNQGFRCVKD